MEFFGRYLKPEKKKKRGLSLHFFLWTIIIGKTNIADHNIADHEQWTLQIMTWILLSKLPSKKIYNY